MPYPTTVCVLGTGLIGGSLLRSVGPERGFGWNRSPGPSVEANEAGFDVSTDLPAVLRRATEVDALVVVGVPMPAVGTVLDAVAEHAPGVALTDVVSVKGPVLAAVRARGLNARFVGGHPMSGTAESGWAATDPELFRGATWVVAVDDPDTDPGVWARVAGLAADCGSRVVAATSAEHDAAVARISHLPHVLAEALAASGADGGGLALTLAAGSFRDGTRVAGSAPGLVRAICEPNRDELLPVLDECLRRLTVARDRLDTDGTLGDLVDLGHSGREAFESAHAPGGEPPVRVEPGAPGWTEVALAAGRAGRTVTLAD